MREQLIQYVSLLFAGAQNCEDIKQEILQNTLDRYDDLIAEGKTPEAAYRLAIVGIGDINEILGTAGRSGGSYSAPATAPQKPEKQDNWLKKCLRAAAIFLYIISLIPLMVLSEIGMDIIGFCGTLSIVALATVLIILGAKKEAPKQETSQPERSDPQSELRKSVKSLIWAIGLAIYFIISFLTNAWFVTWVIFPLIGAVQGLVNAILDLKEASKYEK